MQTSDPITCLKGVGDKTAAALHRLGIDTVGDLLTFYPRNYRTYEEPISPREVRPDISCAIIVTIRERPEAVRGRRTPITTMKLDGPGRKLYLTWYHMPYLRNTLIPGTDMVFAGKPVMKGSSLTMEQPEIFTPEQYAGLCHSMQPVYPLTEGISNKLLIRLLGQIFESISLDPDYLPDWVRGPYDLAEFNFARKQIHFPIDETHMLLARKRLVFDEFLLFLLAVGRLKDHREQMIKGLFIPRDPAVDDLIASLPYQLTAPQVRTLDEIFSDMQGSKVMNRLIQGDVGSGKTIVAALVMLAAAKAGFQSCLMAPTEVLAQQHYETLTKQYEPYGIRVTLLTGSLTAARKKSAYAAIAAHETDIIVGTHALIQEKVTYDRLGLVITDEQHRFGVAQREVLLDKGGRPHVLVMSATPIPRTLAIILYGDLDISVIDVLPAARLPIKNAVITKNDRPKAVRFIGKQVQEGHQVYVICPLVEASDEMDAENVGDYASYLKQQLPDVRIGILHGRQKASEKNRTMADFAAGLIQVLVSTTVVEVGVNVPNATLMMVEDAQRFGLAQLHQLRGRVGRGSAQSYCIFIDTSGRPEASERLKILVSSNDGFYIAGEDLKLRGPGDLFGLKQSGIMEFRIGDIYYDAAILKAAADAASAIRPRLSDPDTEPDLAGLKSELETYMQRASRIDGGEPVL